jgi:hypothetical protein
MYIVLETSSSGACQPIRSMGAMMHDEVQASTIIGGWRLHNDIAADI